MQEYLTFDDVLLSPGYNDIPSRKDVDLSVKLSDSLSLKIPIITSNMDTITEHVMCNAIGKAGGLGVLHRFMSIEDNIQEFKQCEFPAAISLGISEFEKSRAEALFDAGARIFCVDVAHGHSKAVGSMIKFLKNRFNDIFVIAGNVASYAGADYLASCGADAIKVGIGPGAVCSTRIQTGCGVPQLSAIMDCARVNKIIIADGGIRYPGDITKALAAGADLVMIGSLFSGTDETPGPVLSETQFRNGDPSGFDRKYKVFRGMASKEAQDEFMGSMSEWKTHEGVSIEVPYKGPVANILNNLLGGLRSGMTYCGAKNILELQSKAHFIRITQAGYIEGTPHAKMSKV